MRQKHLRRQAVSSAFGIANIGPREDVYVGASGSWSIIYWPGRKGLAKGGGLKIETPGILGWSRPQITNAEQEGYTTVTASDPGVQLAVSIERTCHGGPQCWSDRIIRIKLKNAPLKPGAWIKIVFGDIHRGLGPGARVTTKALCRRKNLNRFLVSVDLDGKGKYHQLRESPALEVLAGKPVILEAVIPSIIQRREKFTIGLAVKDKFNNPVNQYRGSVRLTTSDGQGYCPAEYTFRSNDKGAHKMTGASFTSPGINWIRIKEKPGSLAGASNPAKVCAQKPEHRLYWGDLHCHTSLSYDNILCDRMEIPPQECYEIGRDVAHLDFMAITDHHIPAQPPGGVVLSRKDWGVLSEAARSFCQNGKFITFFGFEFRCARGDTNIYFLEDKPKFTTNKLNTVEKLWDYYHDHRIISIPHTHGVGFDPKVWRTNPQFEPVIEMASIHGMWEYCENPSPWHSPPPGRLTVRDLLARGHKFGFIASSDDHKGQHGFQELVAVYAPQLTRESLFDAITRRRCYGTTGARIILEFSMDGHLMGEEYETDCYPALHCAVAGTDKIKKIEIIRNGRNIYTRFGKGVAEELCYTDKELEKGASYYYLRVTQDDGEMAWSSPIWVSRGKQKGKDG